MPAVLRNVVLVALLVAAAWALRAPFLAREVWNLDEASTFTMAQQVREGQVLFRDAADNRNPLVPYLKATIFLVAGDWNGRAVHATLAVLIGLAAAGLWWIARRLGDARAGVAAALAFTPLSLLLQDAPDALGSHTEWFLVFFSIGGFLAFVRGLARPTLAAGAGAGALFGLAALCKQPGLLDAGAALVVLALAAWADPARRGALGRLAAGIGVGLAAAFAVAVLYFVANGAWSDFVFYAWVYNTKYYVPEVPLLQRLATVKLPFVVAAQQAPWALGLGIVAAVALLGNVGRGLARRPVITPVLPWLILGWTASGLVSTMLSGREFSHYNIQVMPGLSLAIGWVIARALDRTLFAGRWRIASALVLLALAGWASWNLHAQRGRLSVTEDHAAQFAPLIQRHAAPEERIFVWGYGPEYYYFGQRLPATRFIYTNYVTGMIPWTNIDPLVDTAYASIPGGWDHLLGDLARRPPALIVDTGGLRGYLKYPLWEQGPLWDVVRGGYAQVEAAAGASVDVRFYRRLSSGPSGEPIPETATDPAVELQLVTNSQRPRAPLATVRAPAGAHRVELFRDRRLHARLEHPPEIPVDVAFFVAAEDLAPGGPVFQAAVHGADGVHLSDPARIEAVVAPDAPGPLLEFGDQTAGPLESEALHGAVHFNYQGGPRWMAHAPSRLVYARPPLLAALNFEYGLADEAVLAPGKAGSTGMDVVIEFAPADGRPAQRLFHRRLEPQHHFDQRGRQRGRVELPPGVPGRLILRLLPGPLNDSAFDWGYWGRLEGDAAGPAIALGRDNLIPVEAVPRPDDTFIRRPDGRWSAHPPARLAWQRAAAWATLDLRFGLESSAYDGSAGGASDGAGFTVSWEREDGTVVPVWHRRLDPAQREEDRGRQRTRIALPPGEGGRIVLATDDGGAGDDAFDWTYVGPLRGEGPGPDIAVADDYAVTAVEATVFGGAAPRFEEETGRWLTHAPARITWQRPPELRALSFRFGLAPGAWEDEQGGQRSDGIEVRVTFEPVGGGEPRELFRQRLMPWRRPEDRGECTGRAELPGRDEGRIVLEVGPGPEGNSAFDWAWVSHVRGELQP